METFRRGIELKMVCCFLVMFVLLGFTAGKPSHKSDQQKDFSFSPPKKIMEFTVHISEAGEEYNEKIEVDPNKQTELFQVPAHPGVDRSDTLHDFKQNLTMLRFPERDMCFIFPLANEHSKPEKLMRDLQTAKQILITETKRVDRTWLVDSELTDRSVLSDELADFCAQYPIYHVTETHETLEVTGVETEERSSRTRRQVTARGLNNTKLCRGSMDYHTAQRRCVEEPELKIKEYRSCVKTVQCHRHRRRRERCRDVHGYGLIVCHKYRCPNNAYVEFGSGSGETSNEESGEESEEAILERRL